MSDDHLFGELADVTNRILEIPVQRVNARDIYTLPGGREVEVERVDHYDDQPLGEVYVIRYRHGAESGSLRPMRPGEQVTVQRPPYDPRTARIPFG